MLMRRRTHWLVAALLVSNIAFFALWCDARFCTEEVGLVRVTQHLDPGTPFELAHVELVQVPVEYADPRAREFINDFDMVLGKPVNEHVPVGTLLHLGFFNELKQPDTTLKVQRSCLHMESTREEIRLGSSVRLTYRNANKEELTLRSIHAIPGRKRIIKAGVVGREFTRESPSSHIRLTFAQERLPEIEALVKLACEKRGTLSLAIDPT